jgi:hypothetical protein
LPPLSDNDRRSRELISELETLSTQIVKQAERMDISIRKRPGPYRGCSEVTQIRTRGALPLPAVTPHPVTAAHARQVMPAAREIRFTPL